MNGTHGAMHITWTWDPSSHAPLQRVACCSASPVHSSMHAVLSPLLPSVAPDWFVTAHARRQGADCCRGPHLLPPHGDPASSCHPCTAAGVCAGCDGHWRGQPAGSEVCVANLSIPAQGPSVVSSLTHRMVSVSATKSLICMSMIEPLMSTRVHGLYGG